jgi:hypothetical protein
LSSLGLKDLVELIKMERAVSASANAVSASATDREVESMAVIKIVSGKVVVETDDDFMRQKFVMTPGDELHISPDRAYKISSTD